MNIISTTIIYYLTSMSWVQVGLVISFSSLLLYGHHPNSVLHLLSWEYSYSGLQPTLLLSLYSIFLNVIEYGLANFFYSNGNIVNILGFVSSKVSVQALKSAFHKCERFVGNENEWVQFLLQ